MSNSKKVRRSTQCLLSPQSRFAASTQGSRVISVLPVSPEPLPGPGRGPPLSPAPPCRPGRGPAPVGMTAGATDSARGKPAASASVSSQSYAVIIWESWLHPSRTPVQATTPRFGMPPSDALPLPSRSRSERRPTSVVLHRHAEMIHLSGGAVSEQGRGVALQAEKATLFVLPEHPHSQEPV